MSNKKKKMAFVLRSKEINEAGPVFISLKGRKQGLFGWLFTLMKILRTYDLRVDAKNLELVRTGVTGEDSDTMPLRSVSTVKASFIKPISTLIWAIVFIAAGFYVFTQTDIQPLSYIAFAIGLINLFSYVFGKTMQLTITPHSGSSDGMVFLCSRSFIERCPITLQDQKKIVGLLLELVEKTTQR